MLQVQAPTDLRPGKNGQYRTLMAILGGALALLILITIPLTFPLLNYSLLLLKASLESPTSAASSAFRPQIFASGNLSIFSALPCDLAVGEWIPNSNPNAAPPYTNDTCWAIHEHLNCLKYARPDRGFLQWRWRPDGCELPAFNPAQFLELMRHKAFAFVGDNIARNHVQSLICLLSKVEYPIDVSPSRDEHFKKWKYMSYNFTMAFLWTTHLVKSQESSTKGVFDLYLDEFDEAWTSQIPGFDYVMISSGQWFLHPLYFHENGRVIGCHDCFLDNVTELGIYHGYRKAFRTAFKAILTSESFKGITYLRTFAPAHFENGPWNQGGNCLRTEPFKSKDSALEGMNLELYMTQMEEFRRAEREGRKKGIKFRLLDTTQPMWLRPDGHPSQYGHWPQGNESSLFNDCVHWCLPGPIDIWSDFLLHMVKLEGIRSAQERALLAHQTELNQR
ncbi:protein trichome birefringence-like 19 [Cucurbita pepo subsp. pepo]|uniref:protein trichome birefringence-like 19 n=1 Tax=Cucurbita pepo subsp. pepo TaxID=3664 RepID=UPI000C9D42F4|nr:protein trichome birefringence-like 19 [Cucurbita pepo subsp. pepo]